MTKIITRHSYAVQTLGARMMRDENGATAVEYGLIVALISIVAIASFKLVGTNLSTLFQGISNDL